MLLAQLTMIVAHAIAGLLLLLRVADHNREEPRNPLVVLAASCLAAAIVVRFFETVTDPSSVRLTSLAATVAFAAYLYQERQARKAARGAPPTASS